jgi:cytochrome c553
LHRVSSLEGAILNIRHAAAAAFGVAALVTVAGLGFAAAPADPVPAWAFPVNPPPHHDPAPGTPKVEHLPGSTLSYTDTQLDDPFFSVDWFPHEHPVMPQVVASGRKPATWACSFCHLPTGLPGAEGASLAGLPASYIIEQVNEMRAGRRGPAQPKMMSPNGMNREARAVSMDDLNAAAAYFSSLPFHAHVRVVETDIVPKTEPVEVSILAPVTGAGSGTEPLGARIIEVPEDLKRYQFGDPRFLFVAYVPKGSVARGEALVASGDGAAPCRTCHGLDLKGMGLVPGLAGRSPSYLVRQLYDIQHGTRTGPTVAPMLPEVATMTAGDRIAIAAYLASLKG